MLLAPLRHQPKPSYHPAAKSMHKKFRFSSFTICTACHRGSERVAEPALTRQVGLHIRRVITLTNLLR